MLGFALLPAVFRFVPVARRLPQVTYWAMIGLSAVVAILTAWWLYGRHQAVLDRLARRRVAALHGGQAEALVAFTLAGLDDDWHLFNGVAMKGGGDIDHVLVGPAGLFSVSTQSDRGTYAIRDDGRLTLNGQPCNDAADAQARALKLRNWLEAMLQAEPIVRSIPFVRPVLVNPFALVSFPARRENAHLRFISEAAAPGEHVVLVLDGAGWHTSKALRVPANVTLLPLPPYSPELNPAERPWRTLRQDYLSNRAFKDYDELFEEVKATWNRLTPDQLMSITDTEWLRAV